ncbi:unnamed protein product [Nippostrongylus brasiliensis]|uniref:Phospholipase B1, membrane-associated (inferred by orthology to a human protein) n=1 Tax=Nippostrongylus brasiliensis TaxID=27835 RepID=A0A0N4XI33_NIPBR|nr:unnamed protein product [Nippostrongylus brasiliensis]
MVVLIFMHIRYLFVKYNETFSPAGTSQSSKQIRADGIFEVVQHNRFPFRIADESLLSSLPSHFCYVYLKIPLQAGYLAKNYDDDKEDVFPGNSFAMGADQSLEEHITLASITLPDVLRKFNPSLIGASHGSGYETAEFNVAINGKTSLDMPTQAAELVSRIVNDDWKLITIFIGTNDIGKFRSIFSSYNVQYISVKYGAAMEEALGILRRHLNRTIVSLVSIWNSQLVYDAKSLIDTG